MAKSKRMPTLAVPQPPQAVAPDVGYDAVPAMRPTTTLTRDEARTSRDRRFADAVDAASGEELHLELPGDSELEELLLAPLDDDVAEVEGLKANDEEVDAPVEEPAQEEMATEDEVAHDTAEENDTENDGAPPEPGFTLWGVNPDEGGRVGPTG